MALTEGREALSYGAQAQTSGGLCDGPTADGECGATTNYAGSALCWIKDHFTVQFHHKQRQWRMIPSASHQKRGSHSVRLYRRAFYPSLINLIPSPIMENP